MLLISSFLVLMLDSFFFSVIGGERLCERAWTEMMIGAGLLGIGSLGVFSGVAWLAADSNDRYSDAASYIATLARWVAGIIPLQLLITAQYYLHDMYQPNQPPLWLSISAWVCLLALTVAVVVLSFNQYRKPWRPTDWAVRAAAYSSVAYAIISSVSFGILGGRGPDPQGKPPDWVVGTAVAVALALSTLAIVSHMLALPGSKRLS